MRYKDTLWTFALLTEKLVIEIDGDYHNEEEQVKYDNARTAWFNELGLQVLRFTNNEILTDINSVLNRITQAIEERSLKKRSPTSPFSARRRGPGDEAKKQ